MATFKDTLLLVDKVSKPLLKISQGFKKLDEKIGKSEARLQKWQKRTENIAKLGNKITNVGKGLTVGVTLPVIAMSGAMVKLASDMEETINKVDVSFGKNADTVKEWAKTSITAIGLSKQSALDSAALYGDMATGMGLSQEKAADMAMTLTKLGADLSSFKNISNDVAQTALKSIFTGETESLKNLGVVMTQTNLEQFALSKGIRKRIKDMSEAEKIQLRYNYVLEKTKNAHGDFERTGGGASNQMRMFNENLKELGATFGQYILPHFTKALVHLNKMIVAFSQLSPKVQQTILILGGVIAVIGPIVTVVGTLITAVKGLNIALMFLSANPMILAIAGIVAGLLAVCKALKVIYDWIVKINKNSLNMNLSTEQMKKLSLLKGQMDNKTFEKTYGKHVAKAVNNYNKNTNTSYVQNSNNTNTTTNNYTTNNYGNIMPFNALYAI